MVKKWSRAVVKEVVKEVIAITVVEANLHAEVTCCEPLTV